MSRDELRVGNFIYCNKADHIQVQDISSTIVLKLSMRTTVARLVERAMQESNEVFLRNYAAMAYYVNGTVPDLQLWQDMNDALFRCITRHPELYGQKDNLDDSSDAAIIQEEKEFNEAMNNLL